VGIGREMFIEILMCVTKSVSVGVILYVQPSVRTKYEHAEFMPGFTRASVAVL